MVTSIAQDVFASGSGAVSRSGGAGALPDVPTPGTSSPQKSQGVFRVKTSVWVTRQHQFTQC
eukprot:12936380-Prorocentrum_lima.AAC.1